MTRPSLTSIDTWPADALPKSSIDALFAKLLAFYGSKFLDMWANTDIEQVKMIWAIEIRKLTTEQMRVGFDQLSTRKFPPTLPEFIELCKPTMDVIGAYYEAINGLHARDRGDRGLWSHAAIYWAASRMAYDIKSQTFGAVEARWKRELKAEMDKGNWEPIPAPMAALAPPGKSDLSKENATKMMDQLGASSVLKPKSDHLFWAKKIMKRIADGDREISPLQAKFAREALGVAHGQA